MAIKKWINFSIAIIGDGASTSLTANLISDPFQYPPQLAAGFTPSTPTGIINLQFAEHGITGEISGSSVTFTISSGPEEDPGFVLADGDVGQITGTLVF